MKSSALHRETNEAARQLLVLGETIILRARGGSMRPFIRDGDTLSIKRGLSSPAVGDIVWLSTRERDVIHRVTAVDEMRGFFTRGDALPHPDGWFKTSAYMGTVKSVQRENVVRKSPNTRMHRGLVAFLRGLRHIDWTLDRLC